MKVRMIELSQQLKYIDIAKVKFVLDNKVCIKDYAYIIHDKDVGVESHIHLMMRFDNAYDTKHVAQWFCVAEQYLCKIKGKFGDALLYLTHGNAPTKYQYAVDEVVSNFDFQNEKVSGGDSRRIEIEKLIDDGVIKEYNLYKYIDVVEYDKYKKSIDNAFSFRAKRLRGVERKMNCIFISGGSQTGKTTFAKQWAVDQGYDFFVSGSSNDPFDGYEGQDCIILDDLRPSDWKFSDLLKILDNNTASMVKSRYKNVLLECKVVVITTILDIDDFYKKLQEYDDEPIIQLKRRCSVMIKFDKDFMRQHVWNKNTLQYDYVGMLPNPITAQYNAEKMTDAEKMDLLASVMGYGKDTVEKLKELAELDKMEVTEVKEDVQLGW